MIRRTFAALALLAGFAAAPAPCEADRTVPRVHREWIEEALVAAKANRPQLEQALARAKALGNEESAAMEFLVANMPGKGYAVFALKTQADGKDGRKKGATIPYDPLSYPDYKAATAAYDALEKEHGPLDFEKDHVVLDVETLAADFLVRHVESALRAWKTPPPEHRVSFDAFIDYILPYRGSEEPAEDWLSPSMARYATPPADVAKDPTPRRVLDWVGNDVGKRVPFDERWYLHPTDQSFSEMEKSHGGRCEDITNATTYAARARGLAVAQDYTPRWGHRDNNHAWPVLLDAAGRGSATEQSHAAKVYRKIFAIHRGGLWTFLPKDREAPNRWMGGKSFVDVTDEYGETSRVEVPVPEALAKGEKIAYLCVFSGGEWFAMAWALISGGVASFEKVGRGGRLGGMLWLPAVHDGKSLLPAGPPFLLRPDGRVETLAGGGAAAAVRLVATTPEQVSADTKAVTPVSHLVEGTTYELKRWDGGWKTVREFVATKEVVRAEDLAADGLYWLVAKDGRTDRLERPFVVEAGKQRFW